MNIRTNIYLVWLLFLGAAMMSCSKDDDGGSETPPSEERYTGDTYNRGIVVTCNDAAVLPAIILDLSKADYQPAEPVYSTDIIQ